MTGFALGGRPTYSQPTAPSSDLGLNWVVAASVFNQLSDAYANFAAVRSQQYEMRAAASAFRHRSRMLHMDRRAAERRAESIIESGQTQIGVRGLEGAQQRAAIEASTAAAGVEAGVGSAAEVQASERLIEDIDVYHINLDTVRQANATRLGAVALRNEAEFARVSSENLRRSARVAMPEAQLISGLGNAALTGYVLGNYRGA